MSLGRFLETLLGSEKVAELSQNVVDDFSSLEGLTGIVLFGSAAEGKMTTASDIDVVLIFNTVKAKGQRYGLPLLIRSHA